MSMEDSGDQDVSLVSIVDNVALDHERPNDFAELGPVATHARLFHEKLAGFMDRSRLPTPAAGRRAGRGRLSPLLPSKSHDQLNLTCVIDRVACDSEHPVEALSVCQR
jgi:hypothetical protein